MWIPNELPNCWKSNPTRAGENEKNTLQQSGGQSHWAGSRLPSVFIPDMLYLTPGDGEGPGVLANMCSLVTETFLVVVQSPSPVRFSATPWIAARQAFPCLIFSGHLPKVMSIASVMPPPLMPSSPSAVNLSQHRGLSSESSVHFRWPKYQSFSFSISPSSEYSVLISLLTGLIFLLSERLSGVSSSTTVWRHSAFGFSLPLWSRSSSHNQKWPLGRPQPWLNRPLWAE